MFTVSEVLPATCCSVGARSCMLSQHCRDLCSCLLFGDQSATRLCCCRAFCGLFGGVSKLTTCASGCRRMICCLGIPMHVLRRRRRICFCVLRSSMLSTAAQRRLMVTPIRCLESRKCSFPLHLLLLFLWCHKQSCSAPRDMYIGTLTSVYFGRSWSAHGPPPKM